MAGLETLAFDLYALVTVFEADHRGERLWAAALLWLVLPCCPPQTTG